jgi:hypothetical protein
MRTPQRHWNAISRAPTVWPSGSASQNEKVIARSKQVIAESEDLIRKADQLIAGMSWRRQAMFFSPCEPIGEYEACMAQLEEELDLLSLSDAGS